MINALRHQRLVHILGRSFFFSGFCDQRLTASKVSTQYARDHCDYCDRSVINALRHQRLVHNYIIENVKNRKLSDQRLTASKVSTLPVNWRRFSSNLL